MKNYKFQVFAIFACCLTSCEKLIEVDAPEDQLISSVVFESNETAIAATTAIYATMMRSDFPMSYNMALQTGLYSDELDYKQSLINLVTLHKYALNPQDAFTNPIWKNAFNYIYQANAIIEGLNRSSLISQGVKNQLMGEALFTRAFWNYYLYNLYGDIPLVLSTDYSSNAKLRRLGVELIKEQILQDLLAAKELLNERYVAGNSIAEVQDRIRPNTFVVSALLARIYLQLNNNDKAEEEASRIISNGKYGLADLALVFKRTSKEVIWQLELPTNTNYSNSYEARMFTLSAVPNGTLTQRCTTLSSSLLSLFNSKDKRRTIWIGTFAAITPAASYRYPSKYKTTITPADEYTTPFRLAEMYLIRAEARAKLGLIAESINDVDKIRARAGLDLLNDITPHMHEQQLLDSISNERRRELFCEWGLRWFDIKRSPNMNEIMKGIAAQKGATWRSSAALWPIPQDDVLNSANRLKQNEGYE